MNIHLKNGMIERLSPLKDHPLGIVCPRGAQAREVVYSRDRLLYPRKRSGIKGGGRFERITWDEAYDQIIENLKRIEKRYGPEAVCIYTGRGNFEFALNETYAPAGTVESSANAVLFPFGSPNTTGVGALCYTSYGMLAGCACFGDSIRNMREDLSNAELILIWGENPVTDSPPINVINIKKAQRRGARVVVIDHRRSETARSTSAEWLRVRPGTDGALALGMMNVLIQENLFDHHFVNHWTHGFDELREYVQEFTPQTVEAVTGVLKEKIISLARAIGSANGCSILMYSGLEYSNTGIQAIRAVWILQAIAGHLDVPGGKLFAMPDRLQLNRRLTELPQNCAKPIGAEEYPLYHEVRKEAHAALLPRAILEGKPYPIKAMIISGASIITSWPDPYLWKKSLAALDHLVVINRFPTADSQFADILLPATTLFENESYMIHDGYVQLRKRVIAPLGEAKNDQLIFAELAMRLGYGHLWPQTEEELIQDAFRDTGISLDELRTRPEGMWFDLPEMQFRKYASGTLRSDGQAGFETPTGKFEIASEWLAENGHDPLPVYTEPHEGPLAAPYLARRYPLVFNSGARTQSYFRSQHFNIPTLAKRHPHPIVTLHPHDAQKRGIENGDKVMVSSQRGSVVFHACVSTDIVVGVVEANMGGGGVLGPTAWQNANVNELTDFENRDPISGFPVYKALLCEVTKLECNATQQGFEIAG